jgi:hypothetical protein
MEQSTYTWLPLNSAADLIDLGKFVSAEYAPAKVGKTLSQGLSDGVKAILIETGYIDKDYRSTYYNYYSKKGQFYRADCVRLHFFDGTVSFDADRLKLQSTGPGDLTYHYYGYMVLRPTGIATIGRSVLSPDIRSGGSGSIIHADHKAHLLGHRLSVQGFPSMAQHSDIAVCAHVACWAILRHYSERYAVHREYLTHDITMMAQEFPPGGVVPSLGLNVFHAERIFQEANTFPLIIPKERSTDRSFYRQIGAYIESGFPLYATLPSKSHAVVLVGQDWRTPVVGVGPAGMRYAWDEVARVAVVDDNHLPYLSIEVDGGAPYSVKDVDAFIVALPEKIFYPADAVDRIAPKLLRLNKLLDLPPKKQTVIRYFLTTVSALRKFMRAKESEFDAALLRLVMTLPLAQFVWIVEYATHAQWGMRKVAARAVIDATAGVHEVFPFWIFHTDKQAMVVDRKKPTLITDPSWQLVRFAGAGHDGFTRMEQNLRPTHAK